MNTTRIMTVVVLIVASGLALMRSRREPNAPICSGTISASPGREVVQVRVDFDPGCVAPKHWHPGEEIIYVLEGTLEYELEGQPPVTVKAGDVLFVPAGTVHSARNVGSGNGAELATYVVEKGLPLSRCSSEPTRGAPMWAPTAWHASVGAKPRAEVITGSRTPPRQRR